jgi:uncharacterized protein (TIGR02757 family)
MVSNSALRGKLEDLYRSYDSRWAGGDPIALVRAYPSGEDREVAGWIASAFAYGRVETILGNVGGLLARLGPSPSRTLRRKAPAAADLAFFRHRFHGPAEAASLLSLIGAVLRREGSVGRFFAARFDPRDADVGPMLGRVSSELLSRLDSPSVALRFLFPSPADGSACKRWNLYLRWMVRRDELDLGLWPDLPTRALVVPTDTHVHRVARRLGLTRRRTADWTTATEITRRLARLDPDDPVKYDFALCRLGILDICRVSPRLSECGRCIAREVCPVGRRRLPSAA